MLSDLDPSVGVIVAALVTALGVLFAAIATGWYARKGARAGMAAQAAVGVPNGQGTLVQMAEHLIGKVAQLTSDVADVKVETQKNRVEIETARGMVEELGSQLHAHTQEDLEHFRTLHEEVLKVTEAEEAHASTASDDRAQIATDLAAEQAAD